MQRRKFVVGLGSLAAGGAATIGTGAFDRTQVRRDADIELKNDSAAILGIEVIRSQYAFTRGGSNTDAGQVAISLNGEMSNTGATGVNTDAYIIVNDILKITNQGDELVTVEINDSQFSDPKRVAFDDTSGGNDASFPGAFESGGVDIGVGNSAQLGLAVDTRDESNSPRSYSRSEVETGDTLTDGQGDVIINATDSSGSGT